MSGFSRELKAGVTRDVSKAGDSIGKSLKGSFAGIGQTIGATLGAAVVVDFVRDAIGAASDLGETLSKSNNVFGASGAAIEEWAEGGAESFGLSKRAALEAASSFGNMFSQLGIGGGQAAQMSQQITELAADFASFHNADITEVILAQSAAFRGEYDSLQRFLPLMNAATVDQRALEMTGKRTTKALTQQDKALAVHALMIEGAGEAQGDFDRTSESLANQQRSLAGELENTKAEIGEGLLPAMVTLTNFLNDEAIPALSGLFNLGDDRPEGGIGTGIRDAVTSAEGVVIGAVGRIAKGLGELSTTETGIGDWGDEMIATGKELMRGTAEIWDLEHAGDDTTVTIRALSDALKGSTVTFDAHTGAVVADAKALRDRDKATRDAAAADRDLRGAREDLADLLAEGAVNDEEVADAREALADATKDVARANRDLAKSQREYDEALGVANILGTDTALEELADASDNLADSQDNAADAAERERDAAEELRAAQAGDPEFQDKLAKARDDVADASDRVAEAQVKIGETAIIAAGQMDPFNRALDETLAKLDAVAVKGKGVPAGLVAPITLAALTGFETYGNMAPLPANMQPLAAPPADQGLLGPNPLGGTTNNVTVNVTQTDPEPEHIARQILWRVI